MDFIANTISTHNYVLRFRLWHITSSDSFRSMFTIKSGGTQLRVMLF